MKKKILAIILTAVLSLALTIGCSSSNNSSSTGSSGSDVKEEKTDTKSEDGMIGVAIPSADHGWMAGCVYYAQEKVKEMGLEEGKGYKILTSDNVNDQANDIEDILGMGCTTIVLLPHNDEVSVAAQKIMDADINLVVFDRKVTGDYTAYVAGDNPGLGTKGAQYLGEALDGKGTIAVMSAPSVGSVSVERTEAFEKEMKENYPDINLIKVTADGFTQEDGLAMATDMLVANSQIDAVFSIDDEPSLGILKAVQEAGRTDIKYISGGGGAQSWFDKIQNEEDITCFTDTYSPAMIGDAIQTAQDIQQGKDYEKDTIIEPTTVDAKNVADFIDANSPY